MTLPAPRLAIHYVCDRCHKYINSYIPNPAAIVCNNCKHEWIYPYEEGDKGQPIQRESSRAAATREVGAP